MPKNLSHKEKEEKYTQIFVNHKQTVKWLAGFGLLITIFILYWMFKHNLFNRPEFFASFIFNHGKLAPLSFFLFSFINTVYPIIPGGMGNVVGYSIFGPFWSFILAFTGNILGSLVIFLLVQTFGKPLLMTFFERETIDKYIRLLDKPKRLDFALAIAYIVPGLPDDLFSMIAGLSHMSLRKFMVIQLTCKPITMFLFMSGVNNLMSLFSNLFH